MQVKESFNQSDVVYLKAFLYILDFPWLNRNRNEFFVHHIICGIAIYVTMKELVTQKDMYHAACFILCQNRAQLRFQPIRNREPK